MKRAGILTAGIASLLALSTLTFAVGPLLVWNITPSIPTGLYWITAAGRLHPGDRIVIEPPPAIRSVLAERGYLAPGVPLLKRVAAVAGQRVCRAGALVTVEARPLGRALERDRAGRPMPAWAGCRTLGASEVFVMSPAQPSSFDSRYFGPIARGAVASRAVPVWTDERGTGAHIWFAGRWRHDFQQ
jgi:conjugative transfer signal peptidase TraF